MLNASEIMELQNLAGMEKFSKLTVKQALDREKLIELLKSGGVRDFPFNAALADHLIANDVVPVVRCKDCKHRVVSATGYRWCNAWQNIQTMGDDGYCCFGERKNDG